MNPDRKFWNQQQQALRQELAHADSHHKAIELFLSQHAMVHSAEMSHAGLWSFEDEILDRITGQQMRLIPRNCDHSIAWVLWHITRIEDVTMNLLVAGSPQVLLREGWLERMKISVRDTGNAMDADRVVALSETVNLEALRAYRLSVGRRTREIAELLQPEEFKRKVDPTRLQKISLEGAVLEAASDVLGYWGGLTIAGLLLMPPTRHNFIHLNEALRVKQKLRIAAERETCQTRS
jgi:DinB superfamily